MTNSNPVFQSLPVVKTAFVLIVLLGLFGFVRQSEVVAQNGGADEIKKMLEERDAEVKRLIGPKGSEYTQEQRARLKDMINGIIDYREMAQIALEGVYDTLSTDTREEFVDLFSTIIRDQSLNKLDIYRAEVTYNEINVSDGRAEVHTMARLENVRTPVVYYMKKKDGEWVVIDMAIDDVSTAESYQRQFQNIIRKRGFDSLMETLRKRASR